MTETLLGVSPPSSKDPADPPSAEELAAAKELVRQARAQGVALTGPGGLLKALTKTVLETALEEEMAEHLGYDKHDPLGRNRGNSRNGKRAKTVLTDSGEVAIEVPRDRDGSFEPVIVAKRQRRLSSIDEIVLSLYARGVTTGDIAAHFAQIHDAQVSKDTIGRITDRVVEEMQAWTSRPLERGRVLANGPGDCHRRTTWHRPLPVPHGRPTTRPLTLHIQLPALGPGVAPCSCDADEHTERLMGQGSRNVTRRLVGSGPAARPVTLDSSRSRAAA